MKPLTSSRPWSESAASCSAAIHPSVRSSRTATSVGGEIQAGRLVEVRGGLVGGEAQVGGPDLDQFAAHPPPGQRQIGVGAGADHDVHVGRKVLQQEGHALADLVIVDQVVVVEHQPHLIRRGGQLVEQRGEHQFGRHRGGREELQRTRTRRRARRAGARSPRRSRTTRVRCPRRRARATPRTGPPRLPPASHAARSVVLPNPAGADTSVSLASAPRPSRSRSRGRATRPRRSFGT